VLKSVENYLFSKPEKKKGRKWPLAYENMDIYLLEKFTLFQILYLKKKNRFVVCVFLPPKNRFYRRGTGKIDQVGTESQATSPFRHIIVRRSPLFVLIYRRAGVKKAEKQFRLWNHLFFLEVLLFKFKNRFFFSFVKKTSISLCGTGKIRKVGTESQATASFRHIILRRLLLFMLIYRRNGSPFRCSEIEFLKSKNKNKNGNFC
jgi:hypothetical protein